MVVPSSVETSLAVVAAADAHLVMATMLWAPQAVLLLEPHLRLQRLAVAKSTVTTMAVVATAGSPLVMATMLWAPQAVLLLEQPLMFQ